MARTDHLPARDHRVAHPPDRERARLAEHLHDRPIQRLSAAALGLDRIPALIGAGEQAVAADLARRAALALREEVGSLRELMVELRPPTSEPTELRRSLQEEADRLCGLAGVECDVEVELAGAMPEATAATLLDVAREALANAVRHAGATAVRVTVGPTREGIELRVIDDGTGFDEGIAAGSARPGHFGLAQMRHRVGEIGGYCRISSVPGSGTEVLAILPLEAIPA